ncbi:MAG: hypothetical protein H6737_02980 [Alphaproteobacteria bacterium]|nr:hypothetical protein [Alphaproteobacteria bacterium]
MRFIVLPLALAACAPEGATLAFSDAPDDMSAYLVDTPSIAFAERTRVLDQARATLLPGDTEPLYGETWDGGHFRDYTVVDADERMGVVLDRRDWQLVVWLDRGDLATVPVVTTWIGGARVPAGTTLEPVDHRDGETRVQAENGVIALDTWAPDTALDQFWYSDDAPEPWEPDTTGEFVQVKNEVALLDGPLGEPFAFTLPREQATFSLSAYVVEESRGHVRVQLHADDWPIDAWVHEDDIRRNAFSGFGSFHSRCGGVSCGWGSIPNVRADAPLHASPGGPVVGRTLRATYLDLSGEPGDWRITALSTPFGMADVYVDPADLL